MKKRKVPEKFKGNYNYFFYTKRQEKERKVKKAKISQCLEVVKRNEKECEVTNFSIF